MKKRIFVILLTAFLLKFKLITAQSWSELGGLNGLAANYWIYSICSDANNNIYAAGIFQNGSGMYVAKWNGSAWSSIGGAINGQSFNSLIKSLCSDASGNLYAAGDFFNTSGNRYVAKWNGSSWSELGGLTGLGTNNGTQSGIQSICSDGLGNIYAAGGFTNTSGKRYVAKWNGSSWSELGGLNGLGANNWINSICSDGLGNLYAAGGFTNPSGKLYVAKYNGSSWSELGGLNGLGASSGVNSKEIISICSDGLGNIYAAGSFTNTSGKRYVAKWNGSSWSELGGLNGLGANDWINSICSDGLGNIYAAGSFTNTSGKRYVAKWNGSSWSELGVLIVNPSAVNNHIFSICSDASANIYAAGRLSNTSSNYYVAKWNGSTAGLLVQKINDNFVLFPNPTQSKLNFKTDIKFNSKSDYYVYDKTGKLVLKGILSSENTSIDLGNLVSGIYLLNIEGNLMKSFKVVKE
jgi:hypothetical protein